MKIQVGVAQVWRMEGKENGFRVMVYGPECALVGARMRATESCGLGRVHLPGGCMTDTREKESPLPVYDPKVEGW
ncbi:hypothetical protein CRG98_031236 [Punica granatum]|uniref:Uncharacterized protein n=1 Tax=Punica granatum TaxID=22663 RepID=A0A2I0IXA3_PUNGR|nr:hypothetical protein CRG98_031236 [Punica granatum]